MTNATGPVLVRWKLEGAAFDDKGMAQKRVQGDEDLMDRGTAERLACCGRVVIVDVDLEGRKIGADDGVGDAEQV